jgi:hypothetical protein
MGVEPGYEAWALFKEMSDEHKRRKQEPSAEPFRELHIHLP